MRATIVYNLDKTTLDQHFENNEQKVFKMIIVEALIVNVFKI